jgi:WD40 repeat protein/DNA-binding SARP family transcriptional activator
VLYFTQSKSPLFIVSKLPAKEFEMLQIRLLGQFDIRMDGKRVTIPSRAGQSLLAYLLLTAGTPHRREKLAGMFWPDTTDENARKNLRQELWRIRKALSAQQRVEGDYLLADEYTLAFNREAEYWLDVFQMERPDLDLQSLIGNLSLYQGELLPGFYDEWITLERERIQAVFDARMEQLLEQLITAERWIAVQEWGERWLTLSNEREPAYRALMLASGVRGDIARVASLYQRCTDELMEQLGVEPSSETRSLYDKLLKGAQVPQRTAAQPSGTITFLFSDIEESTHLLEKLGDQYADALAQHHEILRATIQKWNGREVDTQGDSFFVTFTRALDAVQCAAEAQCQIFTHTWHQGEHLRVRMGLHTGEPLIASTGYVGMDVHRAARIGDAGHGGQILLSQTTRELVIHDLPTGMAIRDLGEYRLKDMKYPASIYQLVVDGLPDEFAPIRTKFSGAEAPTPGEAPFKGLEFFDVEDSQLFFGRETLTAKLLNRLHEEKFLSVIIGASGSGKSSLVRAGLVPAIKQGHAFIQGTKSSRGRETWQVHIMTPTAHPLEALAIELTRDSESVTAAATLVDDLSKDPRSLHFFFSRRAQTSDSSHTLLVIDQFEELFTLCRDEFEREAFIDNLLTALSPSPFQGEGRGEDQITLIITLRADFYAHLAQYPELRDMVAQGQEYIGPMTTEELRSAIEEPARRGHWEFEPGLVDLILRDVGDEPGALPLLSHALLETWKRRAGHMLTLKGYADAGGVRGAIAHTAENVYENLSPSEQMIMRNILLRLTEFGEGTEDTRRRASFDELMTHAEEAPQVRAVLNRLAEARLVSLSEDTAEVAHEALIREWPQLREWLSQDREGIILHRHLTEASHEWELLERDADALYRGARLAQANEWSALNPNALNAQERMFLDASNMQAKREEQEREQHRERELAAAKELAETQRQSASRLRIRNRVITTVGTVAVILALLAGMFGLQSNQNATTAKAERQRAEQETRFAHAREWAVAALNNLNVDPERSILLALQAVNETYATDQLVLPEAESALHQAVLASHVRFTISAHADQVWGIAYSPDGKRLATASQDGTVKVWDVSSGKEIFTIGLLQHGGVNSIVYSPDGQRLATASDDGKAMVWDASTAEELLTLRGHTNEVWDISFSTDGKRIATASIDGTAKVWNATTGELLITFTGQGGCVGSVAFSPDSKQGATASCDNSLVKLWDASSGQELLTLIAPEGEFTNVIFSPDGKQVASGNHVWDAATGKLLLTLSGHTNNVHNVAYSVDGKRLATTSRDRTVRVWNAATGEELLTLWGHVAPISPVTFSSDGKHLATGDEAGVVKVWDVTPDQELITLTNPPGTEVGRVLFSPDGSRLFVAYEYTSSGGSFAGSPGLVRVLNATTGEEILTLKGLNIIVGQMAISSNGALLAISTRDATPKVWDASTGQEVLTLSGHLGEVRGIVFSSDGSRLATASLDGTAKVWDVANGKTLMTLTGNVESGVAFSPDGTRLATTSSDSTVKVWDLSSKEVLFILTGHMDAIYDIAFDPNGNYIATASRDGTARLWDSVNGQELLIFKGHTSTVFSLDISLDGKRLATASTDGTVKLWDTATGEELVTLPGNPTVAFSPDGTRLVTGSRGPKERGLLRFYLLHIEDLIALAHSRLTRQLTTEECQKYLHIEECPSTP